MSETVSQLLPHLYELAFCFGVFAAWVVFPLYHILFDQRD